MTSPRSTSEGVGETLKVLDLFSGIGGFSLGLQAAGMATVAFCEISEPCRRLLAHHFPQVKQYDDITTLDADRLAADGIDPDVICGGFPCQDLSYAGAGAGLAGARSGLFWEIERLVRQLSAAGRRPRYLVLESQRSLVEDLERFSGPWPRSGMISGGIAYQVSPLAPLTDVIASGLLPTPEASNTKALAMRSGGRSPRNFLAPLWPTPRSASGMSSPLRNPANIKEGGRSRLEDVMALTMFPTPRATDGTKGQRTAEGAAREVERNKGPDLGAVVGGSLNPTWVEWLMGFPLGWTACMALATPSSRTSRKS